MWRNRPAGCGAGCGAGCFGLDAGSRLRPHGPSHQSERLVVALSGRRTCEIRVRHSVMLSARSVCQPVASSGTTFSDNCAYADSHATRCHRMHDLCATRWRRVAHP